MPAGAQAETVDNLNTQNLVLSVICERVGCNMVAMQS